jgi:hypothetical protein
MEVNENNPPNKKPKIEIILAKNKTYLIMRNRQYQLTITNRDQIIKYTKNHVPKPYKKISNKLNAQTTIKD